MREEELKNVTEIELNLTIFNKPKIILYKGEKKVLELLPKRGEEHNLFNKINMKWLKKIKENKKDGS